MQPASNVDPTLTGNSVRLDMLRDTVRSFASDRIHPLAEEIDRTNVFPRQLWPEMKLPVE